MGSFSIWHWLIVALVVILLFGKGRISEIMGETAKGIKAFKKGMSDEEPRAATPAAAPQVTQTVAPEATANKDVAQS
jgi:sec-independent protein translocase protein TatA